MQQIELEELKKIQLNILKDVHEYCEKNDLIYVLGWGTLLGAIRHNGFIPWDDDIDILMPRKDYEKFLNSYGGDYYNVVSRRNRLSYHLPFAKVIDCRTTLKEDSPLCDEIGVYIDIFPMDFVPGNKQERLRLFKKTSWLFRVIDYKTVSKKLEKGFKQKILHAAVRLLTKPLSIYHLIDKLDRLARCNDGQKEWGDISCVVWDKRPEKRMLPYKSYFEREKHVFEKEEFYTPREYDLYLTALYGDYMTLPPLDKRCSHHAFKAFWKNSLQ